MARHQRTRRFERDWQALTNEQRERFRQAFQRLDEDEVKRVAGTGAILEMTWAPDGRATFEYGESEEKEPHLIWRRIGTHDVFRRP